MYELIRINENDYYIDAPTRVGIVKISENEVCLIDSGADKDAGKKVKRHLDENGWRLKAIYNTHFHADHVGANKYFFEQTGCEIFARGVDCALIKHTLLEPVSLYGANPPSELLHKFLVAPESPVRELTEKNLPEGFQLLDLPGHSFDMTGFKTPGGTAYIADALSSRETLDKYKIGVIYDVKKYLDTLESLKQNDSKFFVPCHSSPCESIRELCQYNIDKTHEIADKICEICSASTSFEHILEMLFFEYGMTMTFQQHALVGSTVRSYLTYLKNEGRVEAFFERNKLLWRRLI